MTRSRRLASRARSARAGYIYKVMNKHATARDGNPDQGVPAPAAFHALRPLRSAPMGPRGDAPTPESAASDASPSPARAFVLKASVFAAVAVVTGLPGLHLATTVRLR